MKRSINSKFSRLGTVSALAMVMAAGMGCSVQSGAPVASESFASTDQFISTALATAPTFVASTGVFTVTVTNETAEIYINAADSSLMVNGVSATDNTPTPHVTAMMGAKANVKQVVVVDGTNATGSVIILNYLNGVFGVGTASTVGTTLTLAHGTNTLVVKGTPGNDNFAIGSTGISLTNSAKTPTKDITVAGAAAAATVYDFFLGNGDDVFTSGGNAAVGTAFGSAVAIYGGNGNDTLNETAASTAHETFSGGPGTDTVDYSLRAAAVSVAVDPLGVITSGAGPTTAGDPTAGATEGDKILDADVINGGSGNDQMMGALSGKVTLNGGLGNDTFCQGDDTYFSGTDVMIGGGGTDVVDYSKRVNALAVVMDNKTGSGDPTGNSAKGEGDIIGTDVANIKLGGGGGTYTGNALNNVFFSTAGTDGTNPLAIANTVSGLAGDDTMDEGLNAANNAADTFHGGLGVDTVDYHTRTNALVVTMDDTFLSGDTGEGDIIDIDVENLYGGTGGDTLTGNALDNDIEGYGGNDILVGLAGNDTLVGNPHAGVAGSAGLEVLHGNDVNDMVPETGAFNMCINAGATSTQAVGDGSNCQVVVK